MKLVEDLINLPQSDRQEHLRLDESCIERGGNSTNHKGVLAQFLNTNIPYGIMYPLCHACHNGKCSNPQHLYWGTPSENFIDTINNGNAPNTKGMKFGPMSKERTDKISKALIEHFKNKEGFIRKVKIYKDPRRAGNKCSSYGSMWITNGLNNKRIKKDSTIPDGYYKGRVMGIGAMAVTSSFELENPGSSPGFPANI